MNTDPGEIERLTALVEGQDLFSAIEGVCSVPDPEHAAALFTKLARHFYPKDLSAMVAVARAGIQFCLCCPAPSEKRELLRHKGKALAFNLSANTWPGWGDAGVVLETCHLEAGRDAARLNLRLARELKRGALAESKAHWLVGAHSLVESRLTAARDEFLRAGTLAREAADADNERLNAGYEALVRVLIGEASARLEFDATLEHFKNKPESKEGKSFAVQLEKALEVFQLRRQAEKGA